MLWGACESLSEVSNCKPLFLKLPHSSVTCNAQIAESSPKPTRPSTICKSEEFLFKFKSELSMCPKGSTGRSGTLVPHHHVLLVGSCLQSQATMLLTLREPRHPQVRRLCTLETNIVGENTIHIHHNKDCSLNSKQQRWKSC